MIALAVWCELLLTLVRELARALASPLRMLCYLPSRSHWRTEAGRALAEPPPAGAGADVEHVTARLRAAATRERGAPPHVFVSAGEASGEGHAARLVKALAAEGIRFSCFGGSSMAAAGGTLLYPLSQHAVMGLVGVLRHLPLLLRAHARFLRLLREDPPDLAVLVDYPGLHLVMAKAARRHGVPVLHYIAPQYWAWGPWRMRRYRRSVDATLTILPFEPRFFARHGIPAGYIGHPLLDQAVEPAAPAAALPATADTPVLVVLPGSRSAEVRANLPGLVEVAARARAAVPALRVVIVHRDPRKAAVIRTMLTELGAAHLEVHEGALAPWLARARVVVAKSGTGSLEACLNGVPTVVVYRLANPLAVWGYRNLVQVPFIAAANLVAGRAVVPEFCFHAGRQWQDVAEATIALLGEGAVRSACLEGLREVRSRLGNPGATARVAAIVRGALMSQTKHLP